MFELNQRNDPAKLVLLIITCLHLQQHQQQVIGIVAVLCLLRVCMNNNSIHHRITTESSISMLLEEAEKLYHKPANHGVDEIITDYNISTSLLPMLLSSHEKEQKLRPLLQRLPEAKEASSNTYITEDKRTDLFQRTCYTTLSKYSTCVSLLSQVGARIPSGQFSSISLNSIWWFPGFKGFTNKK